MNDKEIMQGGWQQHDDHPGYGEDYATKVWGPEGPGHGTVADCSASILSKKGQVQLAKLIAKLPETREALKACVVELERLSSKVNVTPSVLKAASDALAVYNNTFRGIAVCSDPYCGSLFTVADISYKDKNHPTLPCGHDLETVYYSMSEVRDILKKATKSKLTD